jgi:hypothetical protein
LCHQIISIAPKIDAAGVSVNDVDVRIVGKMMDMQGREDHIRKWLGSS